MYVDNIMASLNGLKSKKESKWTKSSSLIYPKDVDRVAINSTVMSSTEKLFVNGDIKCNNLIGNVSNNLIGGTNINLSNNTINLDTTLIGLSSVTSTNFIGTTIAITGVLNSNSIITGGITCSGILMDSNLIGIGSNNLSQFNNITANFFIGDGSQLTNLPAVIAEKANKILTNSTSLNIDFNILFQPNVLSIDGYESVLFNSGISFNPSSKILKLSQTQSYLQVHGANNVFGYFGGGNAVSSSGNPWMATVSGGSNTISTAILGWLFYNSSHNGDLSLHRRNGSTQDLHVMTFIRNSGFIGIGSNPTITKPFTIHNDFSGYSEFNLRSNAQELLFGCDTTGNRSYIQARTIAGVQNNLLLNPNGGNVGIGVLPLERLVSIGTVRALGSSVSNEPSSTMSYNPTAGFWSHAGTMAFECRGINSTTLGAIAFAVATSTFSSYQIAVYIKENGYVGVGTTAPEVKFHVSSGDIGIDRDYKFSFGAGYSSAWFMEQVSSNNYLQITRKGEVLGPAITIATNNNVGIGVSSPNEKLEVLGTTISGNLNDIAFDCVTNSTGYGVFVGGVNTFNSGNASIFVTPNLHIDSPIGNGSVYLQYYNSTYTVIRNRIDISDKRIKKDIIKIEEQSQFNNVFDLIKKVGSYTYKYRDIYRENDLDQYGFIAQEVLQHYPTASKKVGPDCYLPNIMETLAFSYIVDDDKICHFTIEGFELDINTKYLFYAFWGEDEKNDFDYLENIEPTYENTFSYKPVVNRSKKLPSYYKLVLVGTYTNDKLGVSKDKLFQLGFAGTNALIIENEDMKEEIIKLKSNYDNLLERLILLESK